MPEAIPALLKVTSKDEMFISKCETFISSMPVPSMKLWYSITVKSRHVAGIGEYMTPTNDDYENALLEIRKAARLAKPNALIQYARVYADAGRGMTGHERHVQCLYILNNLSGWRGETAKAVKAVLKQF